MEGSNALEETNRNYGLANGYNEWASSVNQYATAKQNFQG